MNSEKLSYEKAFDHAWRYFELHASQRMALFNFFLVIAGLVAAGLASAIQGTQRFAVLGVVLGLLLTLVSFIFWKLDQRVCFLMEAGESALGDMEADLPVETSRIFQREPSRTEVAKSQGTFLERKWTYGRSFRATFLIIGSFGVCGSVLSILCFAGVVAW